MSAAGAATLAGSDGTVIHRSDASSLPPILQPAWKATPARGGNRLLAIGGDMFSPMKLQQMFLTPSGGSLNEHAAAAHQEDGEESQVPDDGTHMHLPHAEFTFRAAQPASSSTPVAPRSDGPPSTPGGPHVPLRLFNLRYDDRVRNGLEQLVEERAEHEHEPEHELDDSVSLQSRRENKRQRMVSHSTDTPKEESRQRIPLSYRSTNTPARPPPAKSTTPGTAPKQQNAQPLVPPSVPPSVTPRRPSAPRDPPRSILKGGSTHPGPRIVSSRSISFAEPVRERHMTPRTARLDEVLSDLERLNVTYSRARDESSETSATSGLSAAAERSGVSEASFRVTRSKLIEILTDVAPWEPDWATLRHVDLRARRVESCISLAELLPRVESVWLDHNELAFTTGLPASVRVLTASSNKLTELASFDHLLQLQVLDVSRNELKSLQSLSPLVNLRELWADHNQVASVSGIEHLARLEKLSLSHNALAGHVDFGHTRWHSLAELRLGGNRIDALAVGGLSRLALLDVEGNRLRALAAPASPLAVLRVSDNEALTDLDVCAAPALHTLYADRCALRRVRGLERTDMRRLSLRQQGVQLAAPLPPLTGLERLFLSGNALTDAHVFSAPAPCLVYLELAGCQLTELPYGLARDVPNVRTLNIDHNHVSQLPELAALRRLKRLSIAGCRIARLETITRAIHGLDSLHVLDTRTNPCTLGLYPPVLIPASALEAPEAHAQRLPPVPHPDVVQPDAEDAARAERDAEYRAACALAERSQFHKRAMLLAQDPGAEPPAEPAHSQASALFRAADHRFAATLPHRLALVRRLYRGVCGMACISLVWLDGLELSDADVAAAAAHVRNL